MIPLSTRKTMMYQFIGKAKSLAAHMKGRRKWMLFGTVCVSFLVIYIVLTVVIIDDSNIQYIEGVSNETCDHCFPLPYEFSISEQNLCHRHGVLGPFLVILVTSRASNSSQRMQMRKRLSISAYPGRVSMGFIVGKSNDSLINQGIYAESQQYRDIIQGDFIDSYHNLTLKSVMMLKWTTMHCSNARFVLKLDEDMFFNLPLLLEYLQKKAPDIVNTIVGNCHSTNTLPYRDIRIKYYIGYDQYKYSEFPPFCSGTAYVMPMNLAKVLYQKSKDIPFIQLEDVYISLIMYHLGFKLTNNDKFKLFFHNGYESLITPEYLCHCVISAHELPELVKTKVWNILENYGCSHFALPEQEGLCRGYEVADYRFAFVSNIYVITVLLLIGLLLGILFKRRYLESNVSNSLVKQKV